MPVFWLVAEISAPGTAAPVGSSTVPTSLPVICWAGAGEAAAITNSVATTLRLQSSRNMVILLCFLSGIEHAGEEFGRAPLETEARRIFEHPEGPADAFLAEDAPLAARVSPPIFRVNRLPTWATMRQRCGVKILG